MHAFDEQLLLTLASHEGLMLAVGAGKRNERTGSA